jgi:hypothetical protein
MRLALSFICLAVPATAQDAIFGVPEGCDAYLTVQLKSCEVEHHYECAADPAGFKRDVRLGLSGILGGSTIDDEAQWIQSYSVQGNTARRLEANPIDRHSLTDLFATGVDTFDLRTLSSQSPAVRFVGEDRLTGDDVVIDGVPLEGVAFEISALDANGNELFARSGREYVSREWRMFFSGVQEVTSPDQTVGLDTSPVEFIFPGEPGFLSSRPKHGCGDAIS